MKDKRSGLDLTWEKVHGEERRTGYRRKTYDEGTYSQQGYGMKCPGCGAEDSEKNGFCLNCGMELEELPSDPSAPGHALTFSEISPNTISIIIAIVYLLVMVVVGLAGFWKVAAVLFIFGMTVFSFDILLHRRGPA